MLVGLPLTSGPVAFFLAVDHGSRFAVASSVGSIGGAAAEAGFCLAYAAVGGRASWLAALGAGSLGFVLASVAIQPALTLPLTGEIAVVLSVLTCSFVAIPSAGMRAVRSEPPPWDLPARMAAGTAIVVLGTTIAPTLGPHLTGLLAAFPVYAAVLASFTHHFDGGAQALEVLRGLGIGLVAFTGFFAVINLTLEPLGLATSFGAALAAALLIQGATLSAQWVVRSRKGRG